MVFHSVAGAGRASGACGGGDGGGGGGRNERARFYKLYASANWPHFTFVPQTFGVLHELTD